MLMKQQLFRVIIASFKSYQFISCCKQARMLTSFHIKFFQLAEPQSRQISQKSFKIFYSLFTRNLEDFIKNNKNSLSQLEEPFKVRLKKEQEAFLLGSKYKIIEQNISKLLKQNLQRNSHIQTSINNFNQQRSQTKSKTQNFILDKNLTLVTNSQKLLILADPNKNDENNTKMTKVKNFKLSNFNQNRNLSRKNQNIHRRNASNTTIQPIESETMCKTVMSFKKSFSQNKNRKKIYSLHCEVQKQDQIENNQYPLQCKVHEDRSVSNKLNNKQFISEGFLEGFKPFSGLNTKEIFVKKPRFIFQTSKTKAAQDYRAKTTQSSQAKPVTQENFNFLARSSMKCKNSTTKNFYQNFPTLRQKTSLNILKNQQEFRQIMKHKIMKISSDLAIKTMQPQGYRGKSRTRYKSLNDTK